MPPLIVEMRASRRLNFLLATMHCLGLALLPFLHLHSAVMLALCGVVMVSWWRARTSLANCANAKLLLHSPVHCEIETKVDGRETAVLAEHAMFGEYMIVMVMAGASRCHRFVLLGDSADADALRRLRVWLRALA